MKAAIAIESSELWTMLLSTVRYSMGRSSYIVSTTCDLVRKYRHHLNQHQVVQIRREIEEALRSAEDRWCRLGMECDHREWWKLVGDLRTPSELTLEVVDSSTDTKAITYMGHVIGAVGDGNVRVSVAPEHLVAANAPPDLVELVRENEKAIVDQVRVWAYQNGYKSVIIHESMADEAPREEA